MPNRKDRLTQADMFGVERFNAGIKKAAELCRQPFYEDGQRILNAEHVDDVLEARSKEILALLDPRA